MTGMDIVIHSTYLAHTDPDAALTFYRDTLGFDVEGLGVVAVDAVADAA